MAPRHKTENPDTPDDAAPDSSIVADAIMDAVALEHAESADAFTPEEDRWAHGLRRHVDRELAALRRQLGSAEPGPPAEPGAPRLVLDEPTGLPEGDVVERVQMVEMLGSGSDDLDEQEQAALRREIEASLAEEEAGQLIDAADAIAGLRTRR